MSIPRSSLSLDLTRELASGLVELVPSGAMIVDQMGTILASNEFINSILGHAGVTLVDRNINEFIPSDIKGGHGSYLKAFFDKPTSRQMGAGRNLTAVTDLGKKIPIEIGLNPVSVDKQLCVLATLVDMTARTEINDLLERAIQAAPHGVLMVSGDGIVTLANDSLCKCFGHDKETILGQNIEFLLPTRYKHSHQKLRQSFWDSPSVRMMGIGRDLTALHSDGREFPVEIGLSPLNDEHNTTLVTLTDITDRKKLEFELKESNTNLEEFTYVASHDLRSPLRGMADLLEWIQEDLGDGCDKEVKKNLDRVTVRINRMELLIENLLSYARAGKAAADLEKIDIKELMEDIVNFLSIPEKFVITYDLEASEFLAARTPIETVLRNLINNAVKHHDKEDGHIKISSIFEGNMVKFSVADDGPGVPESAKPRIFRLFQTATASERNSSGIGLSVSRRLTETHGGKIDVENLNIGAAFHVWWPRFVRKDTHE